MYLSLHHDHFAIFVIFFCPRNCGKRKMPRACLLYSKDTRCYVQAFKRFVQSTKVTAGVCDNRTFFTIEASTNKSFLGLKLIS